MQKKWKHGSGNMREVIALIRQLERKGYTVKRSRSNHWKVYSPNGRMVSSMAVTPTDTRAISNIKKFLRRAGVDI